jgi:hypothetical protein
MKNNIKTWLGLTFLSAIAILTACKKESNGSLLTKTNLEKPHLEEAEVSAIEVHVDTLNVIAFYKCTQTNRFGWCKNTTYDKDKAYVTVEDANGNPVSGITVSGDWSGCYKSTASAVTGSNGVAIINGSKCKSGCTVYFKVSNLSATGYSYNSGSDRMNSDQMICPL